MTRYWGWELFFSCCQVQSTWRHCRDSSPPHERSQVIGAMSGIVTLRCRRCMVTGAWWHGRGRWPPHERRPDIGSERSRLEELYPRGGSCCPQDCNGKSDYKAGPPEGQFKAEFKHRQVCSVITAACFTVFLS